MDNANLPRVEFQQGGYGVCSAPDDVYRQCQHPFWVPFTEPGEHIDRRCTLRCKYAKAADAAGGTK